VAEFRIAAVHPVLGPVAIAGTKQLLDGSVGGSCSVNFGIEVRRFNVFATYEATITTPTGSCTTSGQTIVGLNSQDAPPGTSFFVHTFFERFQTGTPCLPVCPPGDDEDEDGLTNNSETLFSTVLGNADSDDDGIDDGNDDANGNGEDDEDEDDDDECPDDDSDGDGEDDEDEDDDDDDDD
jgi:hypothetical protein